jgi:hypothetical protein
LTGEFAPHGTEVIDHRTGERETGGPELASYEVAAAFGHERAKPQVDRCVYVPIAEWVALLDAERPAVKMLGDVAVGEVLRIEPIWPDARDDQRYLIGTVVAVVERLAYLQHGRSP